MYEGDAWEVIQQVTEGNPIVVWPAGGWKEGAKCDQVRAGRRWSFHDTRNPLALDRATSLAERQVQSMAENIFKRKGKAKSCYERFGHSTHRMFGCQSKAHWRQT